MIESYLCILQIFENTFELPIIFFKSLLINLILKESAHLSLI